LTFAASCWRSAAPHRAAYSLRGRGAAAAASAAAAGAAA